MVMCRLSYSTCLTPGPVEPRQAAAGEGAVAVHAARPVHTGVRVALVNVHLAQVTTVTLRTLTPERRREHTVQLHAFHGAVL